MAPTHHSDSPSITNLGKPGSRTTHPVRSTAGKGGHAAQLQKTAIAIEQAQCTFNQSRLLDGEPVNNTAPALRRPRKKKTVKRSVEDTAMNDNPNSDPFDSDSQPIRRSGPEGWFGLQPQAPAFVSRQTLQEYERDCVKNDLVACTGNGGICHKARPCIDSNTEKDEMTIDNDWSHEHCSEARDRGHQMDVDGSRGLFDFDNEHDQAPSYSNDYHSRGEDAIRKQVYPSARDHEDQIMHDSASKDAAAVQPPHRCVQQAHQLPRHVSNTQQRPEAAFPSPPISRSTSNRDYENNYDNGIQVRSAVRRGDEHADTDYDVLGRHHISSSSSSRSPDPDYLSSVQDGTRPGDNRTSKHRRVGNDPVRADPQGEYEIPTVERERAAIVPRANQVPVIQRNHAAAIPEANEAPVIPHNHAAAPPLRARGNDTVAAYEIPAIRQEHGPVVERAGNHVARDSLATAAIKGGEDLAAVARNHQPVSGVPGQVQGRHGRYSKNPKGTIQAKAWYIGFYPPLWTQLLETAKAEMRHSLFRQHPFLPDKKTAVKGECYEVLLGVIARYEKEQMPVERGMVCSLIRTQANSFLGFSERKDDMATLLYDDVGSFRSVIKKATQEAVPVGYALFAPPSVISREVRTAIVKDKAKQLLEHSAYLQGELNENGKTLHFGHPILKQICLSIFYASSRKSLRIFPEFHQSVPLKALAFVAAIVSNPLLPPANPYYALQVRSVLTVYRNDGKDTNPAMNVKDLETAYNKFFQSLQATKKHRSKGPRLGDMLANWAFEGMDGYYSNGAGDDDGMDGEFSMEISDSESGSGLDEQTGGEPEQPDDKRFDGEQSQLDDGRLGSGGGQSRSNNEQSNGEQSNGKRSSDDE
ncbi:hypothetical protein J3R83DRAFT_13648 [Lanmaoa asiatica]|nr:hypothetical protein J3R83DRAFT_13648 [Lanmaoa asiatica]